MNTEYQKGLLPCQTCPWRVDQGADVIPHYKHDLACRLLNTVGDDDAFRPIMACHGSADDAKFICNGYLARAGWSNINVRIMISKGKLASPDKVLDVCAEAGIKLHATYRAVLRKLTRTRRRT